MEQDNIVMEQLRIFYEVWRGCNDVYEEYAKMYGLTSNALFTLHSIYDHPQDCTQKLISQECFIPKQTVNMLLKDLEKRHLIELVPMTADKRSKMIRLTMDGKRYIEEIIPELYKLELSAIDKMGIEHMNKLNDEFKLFVDLFRKGIQNQKEATKGGNTYG